MKLSRLCIIGVFLATTTAVGAQRQAPAPPRVKALVGGLLIDGFAGPPIRNSVILIEGDRISAVGQVGGLAVPSGAQWLFGWGEQWTLDENRRLKAPGTPVMILRSYSFGAPPAWLKLEAPTITLPPLSAPRFAPRHSLLAPRISTAGTTDPP